MADQQARSEKQVLLRKVYVKDLSLESPKAPGVFAADIDAQTLLDIRSMNREVGAEDVEVTLAVKVKSIAQDDTIFVIELVQAGVFTVKGFSPEERSALLGSYCPSMLYPFAREAITDVANKGGFPQLLLQPIDFNALYAQNMRERAQQAAKTRPLDDLYGE